MHADGLSIHDSIQYDSILIPSTWNSYCCQLYCVLCQLELLLVCMKKQQYRNLSAALALVSTAAVAMISLLAFAGLAKPGWLSLLSGLLSMLALVLGYTIVKDLKGIFTLLQKISREAGVIKTVYLG